MTFHKYLKIKRLGNEECANIFLNGEDRVVLQEKIDGANFRFMVKDGKLIFGSRTQELHEDKEHQYQKNFDRAIRFILEKTKDVDLNPFNGFIFYGENCVKHSIAYEFEDMPPFLGFDIYDLDMQRFLRYDVSISMFEVMKLPFVPIIWSGIVRDLDFDMFTDKGVPQSKYAPRQSEGIVIKNIDSQIYAKYVTDSFKEVHSNTFGGTPKFGEGDNAKFCLKYCTNSRIEKAIFKLVDQGKILDMPMMKFLPKAIWEDIWDEEYKSIISKSQQKLDFSVIRKLITKRCISVLKQMITNNALTA